MKHAAYAFSLLRPARSPGAAAFNDPLLGEMTLGVEVTEPELARQCGLGNLDPQHGVKGEARAAIEAALDHPLPPQGARLVTLRPDADALGAMAVLSLRYDRCPLDVAASRIVSDVARADRFERGAWTDFVAEHGPLPQRLLNVQDVAAAGDFAGALAALSADASISMERRIAHYRRALVLGDLPREYGVAPARRAQDLADAWNRGEILVRRIETAPIVLVRSAAPGALGLGYRIAPVVIAEMASPGGEAVRRKVTIAQFDTGWIDLAAVVQALELLEPGWGGTPTILGSPQGVGTSLDIDLIARIVSEARLCHRLAHGREG